MFHISTRSLFSLCTLSLVAVPLLAACGDLLSDSAEDEESAALRAQCQELTDDCEGFVQSYCGRGAECGFGAFEDCARALEENGWRCEQAASVNGGDLAACNADVEALSCNVLASADAFSGTACESVDIQFSEDGCAVDAARDDRSGSDENESGGGGNGEGGDTCNCQAQPSQAYCEGISGCAWMRDSYDYNDPRYYGGYCSGIASAC